MIRAFMFILCLWVFTLEADQSLTQTDPIRPACPILMKLVGKQIEEGRVWNGDGRVPLDVWLSDDHSRRIIFRSFCEDCDYFYLGGSRISDVYRVVNNATGKIVIFKHYFTEIQAEVDTEALDLLNNHPFKSFRVVKTLGQVGTWRILENEFGLSINKYTADPLIPEKSKKEIKIKFDSARAELDEWIIQTLIEHKFKRSNQSYFFPRSSNFLVTVEGELVLFDPN